MTTVIRGYDVTTGLPLPGQVTVDGAEVTASTPTLEASLYRWLARGASRAQAAKALDGYSNGRVTWTSGAPPVPPPWLGKRGGAAGG